MDLEETLAEGAILARAETDNGGQENPALGRNVYDMGFSGRLTNVFRRLGIKTLRDITNRDLGDFACLRNVGPTSLAGLTRKLSEMGLALRDETGRVVDYSRYYDRVWEAINAGAETRTKIGEKTGLSYSLVCRIISSNSQFNERVKRVQRRRDRLMLAELAAKGLTQAEIGRELGVTGERARQLLNEEGLNELRKSRKPVSKFSVREKTIANVLRGVLNRAYARASEVERRAYDILENDSSNLCSFDELVTKLEHGELSLEEQRAAAYMAKHPNTHYPFGRLVSFYRTYERLRESGEKISLAELSQRAGLGHNYGEAARNLLGSMGLQNLTGRERKQLEEWKKRALKRAAQNDSKFSSYDVARFLGMDACQVSFYFQLFGQERKRRGARCEGFPIGYATMSTIYEAFDAGFNLDEVTELAGVSRDAVIYARDNKEKHSPEIRRGLRILFPDRETDEPYLVKGR